MPLRVCRWSSARIKAAGVCFVPPWVHPVSVECGDLNNWTSFKTPEGLDDHRSLQAARSPDGWLTGWPAPPSQGNRKFSEKVCSPKDTLIRLPVNPS